MSEPLSKVDSAVQGLSSSPPANAKPDDKKTRRQSSAAAPGVWNVNDLGKLSMYSWLSWLFPISDMMSRVVT
jgi:hypothetical protein